MVIGDDLEYTQDDRTMQWGITCAKNVIICVLKNDPDFFNSRHIRKKLCRRYSSKPK